MADDPILTFRHGLPLDHDHVSPVIAEALGRYGARIMVDLIYGTRRHRRLHRARDGRLFVRFGPKGAGRAFLDRCDVTYLDGKPVLHKFICLR